MFVLDKRFVRRRQFHSSLLLLSGLWAMFLLRDCARKSIPRVSYVQDMWFLHSLTTWPQRGNTPEMFIDQEKKKTKARLTYPVCWLIRNAENTISVQLGLLSANLNTNQGKGSEHAVGHTLGTIKLGKRWTRSMFSTGRHCPQNQVRNFRVLAPRTHS